MQQVSSPLCCYDVNVGQPTRNDASGVHKQTWQEIQLIKQWLEGYRETTVSTTQLLLADAQLAATSLAQLIFLTLVAAFASMAVWSGIVLLAGIALFKAGVSWIVIGALFVLLHGVVLIAAAAGIKSCTEGLRFTASRKLLSSAAQQQNEQDTQHDSE